MTDAEVIDASRRDAERFADLYRRHGRAVAGYVARRLGPAEVEDVTAEVFARGYRVRARYVAERETALPWLLGIANHVIGDHRRAEARRFALLERAGGRIETVPAPEVRSVAPEVVRALRALPEADRDTLLLVVWGELSYEEAAAGLGVPVGTVRSRISRARSRLATALGEPTAPGSGSKGGSDG